MTVTLVDYTALYYLHVKSIVIPSIVSGKFVQVRSGDALFLVFSPKDFTKYHANIVEHFCMDHGLEGSYDT